MSVSGVAEACFGTVARRNVAAREPE